MSHDVINLALHGVRRPTEQPLGCWGCVHSSHSSCSNAHSMAHTSTRTSASVSHTHATSQHAVPAVRRKLYTHAAHDGNLLNHGTLPPTVSPVWCRQISSMSSKETACHCEATHADAACTGQEATALAAPLRETDKARDGPDLHASFWSDVTTPVDAHRKPRSLQRS